MIRPWLLLAFFLALPATAEFYPGQGPVPSSKKISLKQLASADSQLLSFEEKMAPLVKEAGGNLHVILDTSDSRVNARARREGNDWMIVVYSGMITETMQEPQALSMVLCHELGHHIGGKPFSSREGTMSTEGQADYWSTLACFKVHHSEEEARTAALYLTTLYAKQIMQPAPQLDTPDQTRVPRTFYGYPSPQCRLDTMLAGLSESPRPSCWYVDP